MKHKSVLNFQLFPDNVIITILKSLFDTADGTFISNVANTRSIRIINAAIKADPSKVKIVDFMDTCLWLRLLISIGIFDEHLHIEWCDTIKEYLSQIVRERRYTSRVHDLIDISKYESSQRIRDYARCLLYHLITDDSDEIERQFLLGEMSDIPSLNNTTLKDLINTNTFNNIKYWDVRKVTDMTCLFCHKHMEVLDLTYWDTSNVTTMKYLMEDVCINIIGITNWNTCRVKDMSYMFHYTISFNQPLHWNTSSVTTMNSMFYNATSFNQPLHWNTSNVADMSYMFSDTESFNQNVHWNTNKVTSMNSMFKDASAFNSLLLFNDTSNVRDMSHMFEGAISFNQPLEWDTSNVRDMSHMFEGARSFNQELEIKTTEETDINDIFTGSQGKWV